MVKKSLTLIIALLCTAMLAYSRTSNDTVQLTRTAYIKNFTVKADSLNNAALKLAQPGASLADLSKAIDHIMAGLHIYSKFRDSAGLRQTFDNLGLVYHLQKKYTQAKWFILQSNEISREKHDTLNIIASLLTLASVKQDIKDFNLAKRDLDEALSLAKTQPQIDQQISVQRALAQYYTKKGDKPQVAMALNRIKFLNDSVARVIANRTTASPPRITSDSMHRVTSTAVNEKDAQQKGVVITIITLLTAILAGVCMVFYRRSKQRTK